MKLISWNVNGYRAVLKKGFPDFIKNESPDILGLQETKVSPDQLSSQDTAFDGYDNLFVPAERKGYSGVAVFYRKKPIRISSSIGEKRFDSEGRISHLEYRDFHFLNVYFPNGGQGEERIRYKLDFYEKFFSHIEELRKTGKHVIFCGDVNTAHNEIDLARPRENEENTGFLRIERDWLDKITRAGWVDSFRRLHPEKIEYSWWDYKTRARERNVGWRIDYFFLSPSAAPLLKKAFMLSSVAGSDHCPIGIEIDIN